MNKFALIIGLGLALFPIHNKWITDLTTSDGQTSFFIPSIGATLWIVFSLMYLAWSKHKPQFGSKFVYIPLLVIVISMGVSGFVNGASIQDKVSPLLMGICLFSLYLASRILGKAIFLSLIPFIIIGVISVIVQGLLNPGQYTGGFITNYCASAGYLILGSILCRGKWQWVLLLITAIGLFFIGALEAVFIVGVLAIVFIIRRDYSRKFLLAIIPLAVIVIIWASLGHLIPLYEGNHNIQALYQIITGQIPLDDKSLWDLTSGRWPVIVDAIKDWSWTGHGYSLGTATGGIVHNLPLIIMHQIGPFGAAAWLFVTIYCLIKTKWLYAFVAVLAVSVFDHYLWTQMTPWWWALVGVASVTTNSK